MIHNLTLALGDFTTGKIIVFLLLGSVIGVVMGVIPGLGISLALSVMLAFVYHLGIVPSVVLMLSTQAGSYFSASITAILLNIPGAPESFPTTLDGHPMARLGKAGTALGISATATCLGGIVAGVCFIALLPIIGLLPTAFRPPEYVAIIVFALLLTGALGTDSIMKAVVSGGLGLMISFIGANPVTGQYRFTFGFSDLFSGIDVVAVALGVFALAQMVSMYGSNRAVVRSDVATEVRFDSRARKDVITGVVEGLRQWLTIIRSAILGVICGLVPGVGGFVANYLSYSVGTIVSKRRKEFGTGIAEGIAAPEGSSLAKEVGSLIPALGLGLPAGLGMVFFLAALLVLGLQPGPGFVNNHKVLAYVMVLSVVFGGVVGTLLGLASASVMARITRVNGSVLFPFVLGAAMVGAVAADGVMYTYVEVALFTVVGFALRKTHYSLAGLTIGVVLGGTLVDQISLCRQIYGWRSFGQPLALVIWLAVIIVIVIQIFGARRRNVVPTGNRIVDMQVQTYRPILEFAVAVCVTIVSAAYMAISLTYSAANGEIPSWVSGMTTCAGVLLCLRAGMYLLRIKKVGEPVRVESVKGINKDTTGGAGDENAGRSGLVKAGVGDVSSEEVRSYQPTMYSYDIDSTSEDGDERKASERLRHRREVIAILWIAASVLVMYIFGVRYGCPLIILLYCGVQGNQGLSRRKAVLLAGFTTIAGGAMAWGLLGVLHLTFTPIV